MLTRIFILLLFVNYTFFNNSYAQTCIGTDALSLQACLNNLTNTIILINGEFSLDGVPLPLVVHQGQILEGNYDLITNPDGSVIKRMRFKSI
jgi:hypothetical protein